MQLRPVMDRRSLAARSSLVHRGALLGPQEPLQTHHSRNASAGFGYQLSQAGSLNAPQGSTPLPHMPVRLFFVSLVPMGVDPILGISTSAYPSQFGCSRGKLSPYKLAARRAIRVEASMRDEEDEGRLPPVLSPLLLPPFFAYPTCC